MEKVENKTSSLSKGAYLLYDSILKRFEAPFVVDKSKVLDEFKYIVNTYGSKYYYHENDYILYYCGDFSTENGMIDYVPFEKVCILSDLIDEKIRRQQVILHTLNTIPVGYNKMPDDMRKEIQEGVDKAIKDYVNEFVDLDSLAGSKS